MRRVAAASTAASGAAAFFSAAVAEVAGVDGGVGLAVTTAAGGVSLAAVAGLDSRLPVQALMVRAHARARNVTQAW